ncbi:PepSY domain-containing protein [Sphingomonas sp. PB2P12]|uniref:PepSY domain-containing protein n=1 Tax=Sphingomonas sandaracina TaxID=3096157 RepID=UPI002FC692CB
MPVSSAVARRARVTKALAWFHRWLGIATCLIFALWFASGAVMVFKPFPSLSHADQLRLEAPIDFGAVRVSPRAAAVAAGRPMALRLVQRGGSPAYIVTTSAGTIAVDARSGRRLSDLGSAAAAAAAETMPARAGTITPTAIAYDQWVVHNRLDPLRPFYRLDVADGSGTSLYLSAKTGELVQRTTTADRGWNWVGSVLHWAYFTPLRSSFTAWDRAVWIVSFVALLVAIAGTILGIVRMMAARRRRKPSLTPYRLRWMRWHHLLGLFAGAFVLSSTLSGWLSMDHGRLFSRGQPTAGQASRYAGVALADALPTTVPATMRADTRQLDFTAVDGRGLVVAWQPDGSVRYYDSAYAPIAPVTIRETIGRAALDAFPAASRFGIAPIDPTTTYALAEGWPATALRVTLAGEGLPDVYVDGADGRLLTVMDDSRARYTWIYYALHTFNFPGLTTRPLLRRILVLIPLLFGFLFSITGVVLGVRRLQTVIRPSA